MAAQNKHGLGRGLEALFGDDDFDLGLNSTEKSTKSGIKTLAITELKAGKFQPRQTFNEDAVKALAESIKEKGILQPILVRRLDDKYEIIAGERRYRAAKLAGLTEVPVIEKNMADNEVLEVALVENIVRQDLTAIEEAFGFEQLMKQFSYTQEKLSQIVGKSRSYIANSLRLLALPEDVKSLINQGLLTAGHARNLVGLENAFDLAQEIIKRQLSVRQTEELIASLKKTVEKSKKTKEIHKDSDLQTIENELSQKFGLKVQINAGKNGKGKVILNYNDLTELEGIIDKLEK